jgi:hypothetical protein
MDNSANNSHINNSAYNNNSNNKDCIGGPTFLC